MLRRRPSLEPHGNGLVAGSLPLAPLKSPAAAEMPVIHRHVEPWMPIAARAGDHPDIYRWLLAVFHAPSRNEFHAAQEEPTYEPSQRMVIKRGGRIVSHAQTIARSLRFGSLTLRASQLAWLGTLPEFRLQGAASELLTAAGAKMRADGALVGILRTRIPKFFRRDGWAVCGRHCLSRGRARNIMATARATAAEQQPLSIRQWRHVELPALMRIYEQNTAAAYGTPARTEDYWRWLIGRRAYDHIMVAIAGRDRLELNEETAPIVGYAVVRQQKVIELLTDPGWPHAATQMLARAAGDAIERNRDELHLEAPPDSPAHSLVELAGGVRAQQEVDEDEVLMVKLLSPLAVLERLSPLLAERAAAANIPSCELGLCVGEDRYLVTVSRRGTKIVAGRAGRHSITCNPAELTRLVFGHDHLPQAVAQGRVVASSPTALDLAAILFPRLPLWRPLWDDWLA